MNSWMVEQREPDLLGGLLNLAHQIDEFNHLIIVNTEGFTKEKDRHEPMQSIRSPRIFAGTKWEMGGSKYQTDESDKFDISVR